MSRFSLYRKVEKKERPRLVDYNLIYEMRDRGEKVATIVKTLNVSEGTVYHAIKVREKERMYGSVSEGKSI